MPPLYKVRDKRAFLKAALEGLAGSAFVSFEGNLKGTGLLDLAGASVEETPALKRNTVRPRQDFVVLPLDAQTVGRMMAAVGGTVPRSILHIQVEKQGRLELGMYDNFAPNGIFLGPAVTRTFIETMKNGGLLSAWIER